MSERAYSQCSPISSCQQAFTTDGPNQVKFLMYTPASYQAGTPAPVLISLHGQGQIGDDLSLLTANNTATPKNPAALIAQNQWLGNRPFIVVSPQLKRDNSVLLPDQDWPAEYVDEVIEFAKTLRNVDVNKIYITGLSLGGQGCMIYTQKYPQKIAAMVPLCGRTNNILGAACSLVDIPIWMFHGTEDGTLNVSNAINMYNAILQCPEIGNVKPHLTLIDAARHEIWDPIYNLASGYQIYDWLLKFSKNNSTNKSPYVAVGGGVDKKFPADGNPLYLFGDYFDADGTIASIVWSQTQGNALTLKYINSPYLKISNLLAGTFEFQLLVTDNQGAQSSDRISIQLYNPAPAPSVTNFILMNGTTNSDVGNLLNEQIIYKNTLGLNDINIKVDINGGYNSLLYSINSNQYTRTNSSFFPPPTIINLAAAGLEWKISPGEYSICATPFIGTVNWISKCIKISVFNQFFPKPGLDLSVLTNWGVNSNGTGGPPVSFTDNYQVFTINSSAPQNGTWSVSGTKSIINVVSGGELSLNNTFTGIINVEGNGIVNVTTSQPVVFGSLSPTSTIRFGAGATTIPAATYGHVTLQGASSTKTLPTGITTVLGNLSIENDVMLQGAADNTSTINLSGTLSIQETSIFQPSVKFGLRLVSGTAQAITLVGTSLSLNHLTVSGTTTATVNSGTVAATLELGSATGGGLVIENNASLQLTKNHLALIGQGTLNSANQTGKIGFKNSRFSIQSTSASSSYLYPLPGADTVRAAVVNNTGGALYLQDPLFVSDSVKNLNGILHSNGHLALVSTATKTARIARREGTGAISGAVQFQRFLEKGRQYRYLSFPVVGVRVSDLQTFVPVTGTFPETTTGAGLSANASLYAYQEPAGWYAYPTESAAEEFSIGTGYSAFVRDSVDDTKLLFSGEIHQGNFPYEIQPGTASVLEGWNLLGNPYAAPLQWGTSGWISNGLNTMAYLRDNSAEGRYLIWDAADGDGDEEFGGLIAQGQAFWVKAISASAGLTVAENAKASAFPTFFRTKGKSTHAGLTLSLTHNAAIDKAYVKVNDRTTTSFNATYDGLKKKNGYFNLSILSLDSISVAIKNLPDTACVNRVGLLIDDVKPGVYNLNVTGSFLDMAESNVYLIDTYLDSLLEIHQNKNYSFTVTTDPLSFGKKRFQLTLQKGLPIPFVSVEGDKLISSSESGNQWFLNGVEIAGATETTYRPEESGSYQVLVKKSTCSRISAPVSYSITGIEKKQSVTIYPNPASQSITITGLSSLTNYSIRNALGKEVQKGQLPGEETNHVTLSVPSGIYLISLENDSNFLWLKLVVN